MQPAKQPNATAKSEKLSASIRSLTEIRTANTVTPAAVNLLIVIGFLPPPVKPMRSTIREAAVCPAIDATEYIATPIIGTICV